MFKFKYISPANLIIVVFFLIKVFQLNYPPFYDEAWVYYPASNYLHKHGLTGILSPEISTYTRGHPLLFHCLGWIWTSILPFGIYFLHLLALIIACIFLFALDQKISQRFDEKISFSVLILVLIQGIFYVQSTFWLPEILLTLFILISFFSWYDRDYRKFCIYMILACLTK